MDEAPNSRSTGHGKHQERPFTLTSHWLKHNDTPKKYLEDVKIVCFKNDDLFQQEQPNQLPRKTFFQAGVTPIM